MFSPHPSTLSASYSFLTSVYFSQHFLHLLNSFCFSFSFLPTFLFTHFSLIFSPPYYFSLWGCQYFFFHNNKISGSLSLVPDSLITVSRKMAVIIFRLTWTLPTDKQIVASFVRFRNKTQIKWGKKGRPRNQRLKTDKRNQK